MTKALKFDSGYHGEISVGKPSYTKVTRNGVTKHIHVVDSETWKGIREQLGLVEEQVKSNSMEDIIEQFEKIPPHYIPDYKHSGDIIKLKGEKLNDN
jgi:hypothetical protein